MDKYNIVSRQVEINFFIDKSDSLVIPKDEEIFNTQIIITKK